MSGLRSNPGSRISFKFVNYLQRLFRMSSTPPPTANNPTPRGPDESSLVYLLVGLHSTRYEWQLLAAPYPSFVDMCPSPSRLLNLYVTDWAYYKQVTNAEHEYMVFGIAFYCTPIGIVRIERYVVDAPATGSRSTVCFVDITSASCSCDLSGDRQSIDYIKISNESFPTFIAARERESDDRLLMRGELSDKQSTSILRIFGAALSIRAKYARYTQLKYQCYLYAGLIRSLVIDDGTDEVLVKQPGRGKHGDLLITSDSEVASMACILQKDCRSEEEKLRNSALITEGIEDKDRTIAELRRVTEELRRERDREIEERNRQVEERDRQVEERDRQVEELRAQIAALTSHD